MNLSKELSGASTRVLVLAVLQREASYGYEIVKNVNEAADGVMTWSEGTIYPILHKLQKEGLVRAQWQEAENGRERKYYYITAKGRGFLRMDVDRWNGVHALILELTRTKHG
jgi:PadR family transcriptional regulator PadR